MVKIYGLIEGWRVSFLGVDFDIINQDHSELWQIVDQIKQSKVGIELHKPLSFPLPPEVGIKEAKIYRDLEARLNGENQICSLDDDNIIEEFFKTTVAL